MKEIKRLPESELEIMQIMQIMQIIFRQIV